MPLSRKTNPKKGRPPRDDVDRCQAMYWAGKVREMTGLTFAAIERKLNPGCAKLREDKGGYSQPQLWRKYGAGTVSPTGNGRSEKIKPTAVEQAEVIALGSSAFYNSALWGILKSRKISASAGKKYCKQIDADVARVVMKNCPHANSMWIAVQKLRQDALDELQSIAHIDVLAVYLLHLKCAPWSGYHGIVDATSHWMKMMAECDPAFSRIEPTLTAVLKDYSHWFRHQLINLEEPGLRPLTHQLLKARARRNGFDR